MHKKQLKSQVLFIMAVLILAFFSGCEQNTDFGKIQKVTINNNQKGNETVEFNKTTAEPGYNYSYLEIGRAFISIPYPSTWTINRYSDYDISITAPVDDPFFPGCQIFFHSSLSICKDKSDAHNIMKEYEGTINNYHYSYNASKLRVLPSSQTDSMQVNTEVSDANNHNHITYRDFDADVLALSGSIPSSPLYHHVTAFYWKDYSCILSSLCSMEMRDYMNDLILYMVSNSKYLKDNVKDTVIYTLFDGADEISLPIMKSYQKKKLASGSNANGYIFICPADSETAYSHSSITVLRAKEDLNILTEAQFEDEYLDIVLKNTFNVNSKEEKIYGYLSRTGEVSFDGNRVSEYIYKYDFSPNTKAINVQPQQPWEMIIYPIKSENATNLLILTTPEDSLISTYNVIKLISEYGSF